MKRILFLINSLDVGGAENVLVNIANRMDRSKYEITVMTVAGGGEFEKKLDRDINYRTIIKTKNKLLRKVFIYLISFVLPAKLVYRLLIKDSYDYEVSFLEGVPTKLLSGSDNPNLYAWVHTDLYNYYKQEKVFKTINSHRKAYSKYKKIFCVSESAKQGFIKRLGISDGISIQYNPIDEGIVIKKSAESVPEMEESNRFKIISVGKFVKEKGYDRLLRVHRKLLEEGFDYDLWIIGDGKQKQDIEKYINDNGLQKNVFMPGFVDNPYKYMKGADLFVCSSRVEGYSTVVVEAIMLGLPVVTTDCAGMSEIFSGTECGIIVENDEENLYEGLKRVLSDKELYLKLCKETEKNKTKFTVKNRIIEIESHFK